MKRLLLFLATTLFLTSSLNAQKLSNQLLCGTTDGKVKWLKDYQANPHAYPEALDTLYVPMTIHLVGQDDGSGYYPLPRLLDAFCTLNADFASASIQFYIYEINYINNSEYYNHNYQSGAVMMGENNVPNTLNSYVPQSPGDGLCGYSSYNLGITMAKACMGAGDHTWSHEVGHFLSLPHPFFGWEGEDHDWSQTESITGEFAPIIPKIPARNILKSLSFQRATLLTPSKFQTL